MELDDDYAGEDEYDEWNPDMTGLELDYVIRNDEDLDSYAAYLWETTLDEEFLLWLVPLGSGGTVLPGAVVVHDLPGVPEPIDHAGIAGFLRAVVATGRMEDVVTAVSVVVWLPPDGVAGTAARAWATLVHGAAAEAQLPLRGIVAVGDSGGVHFLEPTGRGQEG